MASLDGELDFMTGAFLLEIEAAGEVAVNAGELNLTATAAKIRIQRGFLRTLALGMARDETPGGDYGATGDMGDGKSKAIQTRWMCVKIADRDAFVDL